MRLSVMKTDAGYSPLAYRAEVFLNGERLELCHTADEELGEAHCHVRDADRRLVFDGDELRTEVLKGEVRIVVPELAGA